MEIQNTTTQGKGVEYIKFAGVIVAILIAAWFIAGASGIFSLPYMMAVMGLFLIIFALFQLVGYQSFVDMFPEYDPIAARVPEYSHAYPFIGIFLGVLYLLDIGDVWRDGFTAFILLVGAVGVYLSIRKDGSRPHCACLGNIIKLPLSWVTFFEDAVMGLMALVMLLT